MFQVPDPWFTMFQVPDPDHHIAGGDRLFVLFVPWKHFFFTELRISHIWIEFSFWVIRQHQIFSCLCCHFSYGDINSFVNFSSLKFLIIIPESLQINLKSLLSFFKIFNEHNWLIIWVNYVQIIHECIMISEMPLVSTWLWPLMLPARERRAGGSENWPVSSRRDLTSQKEQLSSMLRR